MYRLAAALLLAIAGPALSAPVRYVLEPAASSVGFETDFGPDRITGRMPVTRADLTFSRATRRLTATVTARTTTGTIREEIVTP